MVGWLINKTHTHKNILPINTKTRHHHGSRKKKKIRLQWNLIQSEFFFTTFNLTDWKSNSRCRLLSLQQAGKKFFFLFFQSNQINFDIKSNNQSINQSSEIETNKIPRWMKKKKKNSSNNNKETINLNILACSVCACV